MWASAVSGATSDLVSSPLEQQTAEFWELRQKIEESILPLSTSVDGRRFELQASLHGLELQVGGYVVLESDEGRRLGQIVALDSLGSTAPR